MRNVSLALKAWLASNNILFRADLVTLTLLNGTVFRWTTSERSLQYGNRMFYPEGTDTAGDNGLNAVPLIQRSTYNQSSKMVVDTLDLTLTGGTKSKIGGQTLQVLGAQGYFDGARINIDHVMGSD